MAIGEEMHEHAERAEHGKHDSSLAPVSLTMGIIAVVLSAVSLLGHRAHTQEILTQTRISNGWAQYQAKSIRRSNAELFGDLVQVARTEQPAALETLKAKYHGLDERYRDELKELEEKARAQEEALERVEHQADRFDLGEGFLEVALVVTSITLLTKKRAFWFVGMGFASVGVIFAISSFLLH